MTMGGEATAAGGADPATPRCYRHPNREALIRCTRCDRPICPDCMRPAAVGFHCPDDVAIAARALPAPRTSVGAVWRQSPPYVTGVLIAANVVVYLITGAQSVGGLAHPAASRLFIEWQLFPFSVHAKDEYYRLITSAFLHLSLLHIASNMLALGIIGPPLERLLGRWRFLAVYVLGALGGSTAVYLFGNEFTPVAGASGAIFGLFGASLVLVRRLGLDLQWLLGIVVLNFVLTFSIANISKLGHVGGFLAGGLAALAIAGLPRRRDRVAQGVQVAGLAGIAAVVVVLVALRSATF